MDVTGQVAYSADRPVLITLHCSLQRQQLGHHGLNQSFPKYLLMLKLLGILVVAAGFALRLNTLLSVLAAGIITGLVAGYSLNEIMAMLGSFFIDNRFMTLPVILMMPAIGLLEKYGLQERAAILIRGAGAATAGRVLMLYQAIREGTSMLGLSIGNHASMVRPLIAPMAEGAAAARHGDLSDAQVMQIRAHAAASENIGNFFADDILVAVGPVLLMKGFFDVAGVPVELLHLAWWGLPTAAWVLAVGWWRNHVLDQRLRQMTAAARVDHDPA